MSVCTAIADLFVLTIDLNIYSHLSEAFGEAYRSWKVMKFKIHIFPGLESYGIRHMSWKIVVNQPKM